MTKCRNCKTYEAEVGLGICRFCDQKEREFERGRKPRNDIADSFIVVVILAAVVTLYFVVGR